MITHKSLTKFKKGQHRNIFLFTLAMHTSKQQTISQFYYKNFK